MSASLVGLSAPPISVIIPVYNCPGHLSRCLGSLQRSEYRNFEVIVVDDASTDHTPQVAAAGARVVQLPVNSGPAVARNRGAEEAVGDLLLFLDADVLVHPTTVGKVMDTFEHDLTIDAVFGSYDASPRVGSIISQYRNLLHHFTHQMAEREASTFWAGCGAVRRSVFLEAGGFDTGYRRPCIEDIEFGVRLNRAGRRIVLNRDIQVKHLKRWTLWGMLKTDYRDRALPWTELIMRDGDMPNDLNVQRSQRASALLSLSLLGALGVAAVKFHALIALLPLIMLLAIALLDRWSLTRRVPTAVRAGAVLLVVTGAAITAYALRWWTLVPIGLAVGIVVLNRGFYVFLSSQRHPLFAALVFPLHVFYYLYSGMAFAVGLVRHKWQRFRSALVRACPSTSQRQTVDRLPQQPR